MGLPSSISYHALTKSEGTRLCAQGLRCDRPARWPGRPPRCAL